PSTGNNSASSSVLVLAAKPDLAVTKTASAAQVAPGDAVVYTINVTNNGTATAHNVVVSDDLPLNLRFESATTTKGSCDPALPTCTMDSLDPGESATVTIAATFLPISTQGPLLTNTVTATADDEDGDAG